jgi:imidazolonepropionase-like amidohydrolase
MPIAWAGLLEAFVVMVSEKLILYPSIVYTPQDLVNRLRVSADRSIVIPEKGKIRWSQPPGIDRAPMLRELLRRCGITPRREDSKGAASMPNLDNATARLASILGLALVVAGGAACSGASDAEESGGAAVAADSADYAFLGVNVVPMDEERVVSNQTVLVLGDRIVAIGNADGVSVPEGAERIDARGKYLMPGLAEMHAHIPSGQAGGPDFTERVLLLYLANGITTIRGMLGAPVHLELRSQANRGEILSPRIYTSGPSINGNSIPSPDSAGRAVRQQKLAGYDFLKIHPGLSREAFETLDEVADSAGIGFAGHVPAEVGLERALEASYLSIDHLDGYAEALVRDGMDVSEVPPSFFGANLVGFMDEAKLAAVAAATREAGVWNVPTQSLIESIILPEDPEAMAARPEMAYMPPEVVANWVEAKQSFLDNENYSPDGARRFVDIRRKLIKALNDAGAGLLLGSDAPQVFQVPGWSMRAELVSLVAAGLTPYEALTTGTRNIAAYFDELDEWGTIEAGKVADLLLLDANPLENVSYVELLSGVMTRGRWVPRAELDEILEGLKTE